MTLLRPLIHTQRSSIRRRLSERGWTWIEDPSNDKPEFERVRIRQFLARHPNLASLAEGSVSTLQQQRTRDLQRIGRALLDVCVHPDGLIDTDSADLSDTLIKILACCASGSDREPRGHAVRNLRSQLTRLGQRQTLGGAWFKRTRSGYLIGRDPADQNSSKPAAADRIFDGRYERDSEGTLPERKELAFLVRESAPYGPEWREIISDRLRHIAACYQTPLVNPVQR